MKRIQWAVISLLVILVNCMPPRGEVARPVAFRSVPDIGEWVLGDQPAYLVVTEKNWSIYYSSLPKGADFDAYIYVIASLGVQPNPGYRIRVLQIEQMKDRITIRIELKEPDPKMVYPQVIVHPIAVAKLAKVALQPGGSLNFVFVDQKGQQLASLRTEV